MKIVITNESLVNPGDLSWKRLEKFGELVVYSTPAGNDEEMIQRSADADILIAGARDIPHGLIEACPKLKGIFLLSTGFDAVDLEAARKRGIPVCNSPTYGTASVGQFAIALLLAICGNANYYSDQLHAGIPLNFAEESVGEHRLIELEGKTMGIIGFGRIGRRVGLIAKAMGMKIIAYDLYECEEGQAIGEYVSLEELIASSDVVSIHAALDDSNRHLINADAIAKMKDGVIIINNARGGIIDSKALADALISGKVYAAGLDVLEAEPIRPDDPLLTAPRCIITPHISWLSKEARQKMIDGIEESIQAFLDGKPINNVAI